jgi:cytochrome c556
MKIVLLTAAFVAAFFYSCNNNSRVQTTDAKADSVKVSELALLMRDMYQDAEQMKADLQNGKLPVDFREKFKAIHSAIPTEPLSNKPAFDAMAQGYLAEMDSIYSFTDATKRVEKFNLMVQNCVTCHQQYCPGPIKRIKKLII